MTGESASRAEEEKWLDIAGSRVRVLLIGQGPELLLLNGIGAHSGMWEPLVEQLCGTRRLVLLDMPGAGASPPLRRPVRMSSLATLVVGVLDGLALQRADVLGYSWGGALAQQLARDHPHRVDRLCLVSTVPGVGGRPPSLRVAAAMMDPTRFSTRERAREAATLLYGGEYRQDDELAESALQRWHDQPPSKAGYAQQLFAIAGWSSIRWLRQIKSRTLILSGGDDPLVPLRNAHLMTTLLRDATLHIVPNGGHLWLLDHAGEAAAVIEHFLRQGRA